MIKSRTAAKFQDVIRSQIPSVFLLDVWHLTHGRKIVATPLERKGEESTCVSGRKKKKVTRSWGWELLESQTFRKLARWLLLILHQPELDCMATTGCNGGWRLRFLAVRVATLNRSYPLSEKGEWAMESLCHSHYDSVKWGSCSSNNQLTQLSNEIRRVYAAVCKYVTRDLALVCGSGRFSWGSEVWLLPRDAQ